MNYRQAVHQIELEKQEEEQQRQLQAPEERPIEHHRHETLVPGHTAKSSIRRHEPETVGERYERKMLDKGIEPTATTSHQAEESISTVPLAPEKLGEKIQKNLGIKSEEQILEKRAQRGDLQARERGDELVSETGRTKGLTTGTGRPIVDVGEKSHVVLPPETTGEKIQKTLGIKTEEEILLQRAQRKEAQEEARELERVEEREIRDEGRVVRGEGELGLPKETFGEKIQRKTGMKTEEEILTERKEKAISEHPHVEHEHVRTQRTHEPLPKETLGEKLQRKTGIKTEEEILAERQQRAPKEPVFTKEIHEPGYVGNVLPKETVGEKLQRKTGIKTEEEILDERRERAAKEHHHERVTTGIHEPLPKETFGEKIQRKTGMKSDEEIRAERRERGIERGVERTTAGSEYSGIHEPGYAHSEVLPKETLGEKFQRKTGMKSDEEILAERRERDREREIEREVERTTVGGEYSGIHEPVYAHSEVLPKETFGEKIQRKTGMKSDEEILAERRERDREQEIEAEKRSKSKRYKAIPGHVMPTATGTATTGLTTGFTTATVEEPVPNHVATGRTKITSQSPVTPPSTPTERPAEFGENIKGLEEQPAVLVTPATSHPSYHPTSLPTSRTSSLPSSSSSNIEVLVHPDIAGGVQHVSTPSSHPSAHSSARPSAHPSAHPSSLPSSSASSSSSHRPSHSSSHRSGDIVVIMTPDMEKAIDIEAYEISGKHKTKYETEIGKESETELPESKSKISSEKEIPESKRKSKEISSEKEIPESKPKSKEIRKSKEISTEREIPRRKSKETSNEQEIPESKHKAKEVRESERQYEKRLEREAELHLGRRLEQETEQQREQQREQQDQQQAEEEEPLLSTRQVARPVDIPITGKRETRRTKSDEKIKKRLKEQQEEEQEREQQKRKHKHQKEELRKVKPIISEFRSVEGEQFEHK